MFCFVNISKTKINSDEFSYRLLKKFKVATIPGIFFGKRWNDHIRVSLCNEPSEFRNGVIKLAKFTESL